MFEKKNIVNSEGILTSLIVLGHCSAHFDQMFFYLLLLSKLCPFSKSQISAKNMSIFFKIWKHAHTLSHDHLGL